MIPEIVAEFLCSCISVLEVTSLVSDHVDQVSKTVDSQVKFLLHKTVYSIWLHVILKLRFILGYSRKKSIQGGWGQTFLETPWNFLGFLLYPWKYQTKQSFTPRNSTKLCYTPQKLYGLKPRPLEIPYEFFLIPPGNSTLFLISPWKFYLLFLQ